ncbi:hypothetical protein E3O45_15115 [Cryobacterium sp. TMS1-20-1]|uniref:hypothetical protein n=1 Tax=Cryobacterium sp. TMS1-20-1 TaxID=1259223 RepID=UPI00106AA38D|nr:hypothetical protein [Cryobacterium sp. TMS1-20-1]TFC71401.1 hypothetical protein E3O45_15115 [Cryobacterium sp. TMS1-20-1]
MSEARCKVCAHSDREKIDAALATGTTNVAAGERWGMSKDAVRRHRASHLSKALMAVTAQRETGGAVKAIDRAEALYSKAEGLLDAAQLEGKASLSLAAIRELRGIVELLAKLTGELDERPTVQVLNVSTSPEWSQLRGVLLGALGPFPEAHLAVAGALGELEQ